MLNLFSLAVAMNNSVILEHKMCSHMPNDCTALNIVSNKRYQRGKVEENVDWSVRGHWGHIP